MFLPEGRFIVGVFVGGGFGLWKIVFRTEMLRLDHRLAGGDSVFLWYEFISWTDLAAEPVQVYVVYTPHKNKFKMFWNGRDWTHYKIRNERDVDTRLLDYLGRR
jgi:hypothetical protein